MIWDTWREQVWQKWLADPENDLLEHREELHILLEAIATSKSEDTLNSSARALEESELWRNSEKLRRWFQTQWLAHAKV